MKKGKLTLGDKIGFAEYISEQDNYLDLKETQKNIRALSAENGGILNKEDSRFLESELRKRAFELFCIEGNKRGRRHSIWEIP